MLSPSLQIPIRQLIHKSKRQLGMLHHVIEAQELNLILRRVDLIIRVLEVALDHESGRVARLGR